MTDKHDWEGGVGRSWASEWERTDRSFAELTRRLLDTIAALLPHADAPIDLDAPGPFAFADADRVRGIMERAGWRDISFAPHDIRYIAGKGDDPVGDALAYFARIGPAAHAMRALPEIERPGVQARLADFVAEHRSGDTVAFDAATWIVTATKA